MRENNTWSLRKHCNAFHIFESSRSTLDLKYSQKKEERTKKANDAQVAAMAVGAADLADLRDQLAASNKRTAAAMAAGGGGGSGLAGGAAPKKPKTGNGAVNTGANNTSLKTKRTARLVQLISAYTKTNPVDGYAPANHVGVKPLCVWTATGKSKWL